MPSKSARQRRFMGAELSRARAGKKTQTGMSEEKLSDYASKSMDVIDAYLFKHGRILPCGHHAEEGSDVDKACTMSNCGGVGGIGNFGSGSHNATSPSQWTSASWGGGRYSSGTAGGDDRPGGGGYEDFEMSADPIELIDAYLNKQSRHKCGHKKGDPNHLEAA